MSNNIPESIRSLTDRIAAACNSNNYDRVISLITKQKSAWEEEIRQQIRIEQYRQIDEEMKRAHGADCYFETKDGLRILHKIELDGEFGLRHWPIYFKRACRHNPQMIIEETPNLDDKIEIREYELTSRARDGRPIYTEV